MAFEVNRWQRIHRVELDHFVRSVSKYRKCLPIVLVGLLVGGLVWRETEAGLLIETERSLSRWIQQASGQSAVQHVKVTLVFQGGISSSELTTLDVALFVRAAERMGARVAAIAASHFAPTAVSLPQNVAIPVVYGVLLSRFTLREGISPMELSLESTDWQLEEFAGYSSSAPIDIKGQTGGFINLSARVSRVPILGNLNGQVVGSFPLACYFAFQKWKADEVSGLPNKGLKIHKLNLPLGTDGTLPLRTKALKDLHRLDMDDLLLAAERKQQGHKVDDNIQKIVDGSILILGTLTSEQRIETGENEFGRRLSLAEYQGMGLLSLAGEFFPRGIETDGKALLWLLCGIGSGIFGLVGRSRVFPIAAMVVAGWLLAAFAASATEGTSLPMLFPLAIFAAGWIVRIVQEITEKKDNFIVS